jgi:hypothetical protein
MAPLLVSLVVSSLAPADYQLDREAATLDCARPRVLGDHAPDSPRARAADATHGAVCPADPPLRRGEPQCDHPRHAAAHRRRWWRRRWWRRRWWWRSWRWWRWRRWRRWRWWWWRRWWRGWSTIDGGERVDEPVTEVVVGHVVDAAALRPVRGRQVRIGTASQQRLRRGDVPDQLRMSRPEQGNDADDVRAGH